MDEKSSVKTATPSEVSNRLNAYDCEDATKQIQPIQIGAIKTEEVKVNQVKT